MNMIKCTQKDYDSGTMGACMACGAVVRGIDHRDARLVCDACGQRRVYGYGELASMCVLAVDESDS